MEKCASRKPNWTIQAILCAGVVAWQSYDLATAVEARPAALLALQYLALAGGLIGGVGALVMLARGAPSRG
jgi:predicted membrane protein